MLRTPMERYAGHRWRQRYDRQAGHWRTKARVWSAGSGIDGHASKHSVTRLPFHLTRSPPLQPTATIVLPVHNMERSLRPEVLRILDLAEVLGRRVAIAIVDDGSHDATYEIACDLARVYPQVSVLRQPYQRGLGGALEQVRTRLRVDQVVAHDGVAAINVEELAEVLCASPSVAAAAPRVAASDARGSRRLGRLSPPAMPAAAAPRALRSFRWLRLDEPLTPRRSRSASTLAEPAARRPVAPVERVTAFGSPASLAN